MALFDPLILVLIGRPEVFVDLHMLGQCLSLPTVHWTQELGTSRGLQHGKVGVGGLNGEG